MSNTGRRTLIISLAAVLTGLIATGGVWLFKRDDSVVELGYRPLSPQASASAQASAAASESPSPSPSASKSPSSKPKPKPSPKPVPKQPAPPPPPSEPTGCTAHYEGTNVPREQVGTALDAAAARHFWTESKVTLAPNLLKAVAEQESGWQSAIVSCVGAVGAMQVVPSTADWMNQWFSTSFNVRDVQGNAMVGSEYLQWLIKHFADRYFDGNALSPKDGDYTVRASDCSLDPAVPDHREFCLLNTVIAAYNVGQGTVEKSIDDGDKTYYPNHAYIENVRALMSRF